MAAGIVHTRRRPVDEDQGDRRLPVALGSGPAQAGARRPSWADSTEVANPMSRYPRYKRHRGLWAPSWPPLACVVTAEDGTWGLGMTTHSGPAAPIINDHFAPLLAGEECAASRSCGT